MQSFSVAMKRIMPGTCIRTGAGGVDDDVAWEEETGRVGPEAPKVWVRLEGSAGSEADIFECNAEGGWRWVGVDVSC